jgi:hypothetical protein
MINATLSVGTTAVKVTLGANERPVIVNTGSTTLYFGNTNGVTAANGIPLGPNVGYEFPMNLGQALWNELWVISSAVGGELRYAQVG